jgi:hypothetical protein
MNVDRLVNPLRLSISLISQTGKVKETCLQRVSSAIVSTEMLQMIGNLIRFYETMFHLSEKL